MTRLSEAIAFAARCHDGMLRKGTMTPYIVHPMEVAAIVAALTDDEDILCAAGFQRLHNAPGRALFAQTQHGLECAHPGAFSRSKNHRANHCIHHPFALFAS